MTNTATTPRTRLTSGEVRAAFPDAKGRPMGRSRFERLVRDFPELRPIEDAAAGRLWPSEALDGFRAAIAREECGR